MTLPGHGNNKMTIYIDHIVSIEASGLVRRGISFIQSDERNRGTNESFISLLSGLISAVFEKAQYLQCFAAKIFGVDLKSRPQDSCRISERLAKP